HEAPIIKQTKLTTHLSNLKDELNQRVHNVEKLGLHHMADRQVPGKMFSFPYRGLKTWANSPKNKRKGNMRLNSKF
ncbi:unnamed protein product, partial [Musa acuminata var. zebrina]